jgi:hypothetical protein
MSIYGRGLNPLNSLSGVQKQTRLEIITFDIHSNQVVMNLFISFFTISMELQLGQLIV